MRRWFVPCLLLLALTASAAAQSPKFDPDAVRALVSNYELTNADGDRKCPMSLDAKTTGAALALVYDRAECAKLFAWLAEVGGWLPGPAGSIRLVRTNGRLVLEFTEGVEGSYEAIREGDAVYFLVNLQFAKSADAPQFSDLLGEWNLARPGGPPICRVTLTETPAPDESFKLHVQAGCDSVIMRFGPIAWRFERGDIVLLAQNGEKLRFGRQEGGEWAKVPDTPRPLSMSRVER